MLQQNCKIKRKKISEKLSCHIRKKYGWLGCISLEPFLYIFSDVSFKGPTYFANFIGNLKNIFIINKDVEIVLSKYL